MLRDMITILHHVVVLVLVVFMPWRCKSTFRPIISPANHLSFAFHNATLNAGENFEEGTSESGRNWEDGNATITRWHIYGRGSKLTTGTSSFSALLEGGRGPGGDVSKKNRKNLAKAKSPTTTTAKGDTLNYGSIKKFPTALIIVSQKYKLYPHSS